jgi:hypothetical protein
LAPSLDPTRWFGERSASLPLLKTSNCLQQAWDAVDGDAYRSARVSPKLTLYFQHAGIAFIELGIENSLARELLERANVDDRGDPEKSDRHELRQS